MPPPPLVCNGFPKAGNHALWKAVELLGVPGGVNHVPYVAEHATQRGVLAMRSRLRHVFIIRDPRDVIVSWLRFNRDAVTPGKIIAAFRRFRVGPLVDELEDYAGWLRDPWTHVIRYEALIRDDGTMRELADYLGVPYIAGAWEQLPNHTKTWNAVHSDHREHWTPEVAAVWAAEGGPELLARFGY